MKHGMKMMMIANRDEYPEDKYRDRRGREHYENGRYAPKNEWEAYIVGDKVDDGTRRTYTEYVPPRMNQIGFSSGEEVRHDYSSRVEDKATKSDMQRGGASSSAKFNNATAQEWMRRIKNTDGTTGAHWTLEEVKDIARQKSLDCDPTELWATMNMMYSDYAKVAKRMNINNVDFYLGMALAFLNDADAVPDKLAVYYESVVKHA